MELNQIKQFRVIARTESVSKAAEILFIAQPSLSQTLKRLETELGTPLFDRRGKRIVLNGAGKIFLKYCDEIVAALDSAVKEIDEYKGSGKSDINILINSISLIIPEVAEKMRKHCPWSLPHFYRGSCEDWDLKICYSPCPRRDRGSRTVIEEPVGVIMPDTHYLASKKEITKKDLEGCSFLSLSPDDGLTEVISHLCAEAGFKPNITMYAESPSVMKEMLKRGLGVAFVPLHIRRGFNDGALTFRAVKDMPMKSYVYMAMNDKEYVTKEVKSCFDAISGFYVEYARTNGEAQVGKCP